MMTSGDACPTIRLGLVGTRHTGALALMAQQREVVYVIYCQSLTGCFAYLNLSVTGLLPGGVMVTLEILVLSLEVRVLPG